MSWPTFWEFSPRWKTYVADLQPWKNLMSKKRFIAGIYTWKTWFHIKERALNQHPKWLTTPKIHKTPGLQFIYIYISFCQEEICEVNEGFSTTYHMSCFQPQICQSYQPLNLGASKRWRDSASSWWSITMILLILNPTLMVRARMILIVRIFFSNYTWSRFPFSVVHFQTRLSPFFSPGKSLVSDMLCKRSKLSWDPRS